MWDERELLLQALIAVAGAVVVVPFFFPCVYMHMHHRGSPAPHSLHNYMP